MSDETRPEKTTLQKVLALKSTARARLEEYAHCVEQVRALQLACPHTADRKLVEKKPAGQATTRTQWCSYTHVHCAIRAQPHISPENGNDKRGQ